MSAQDIKSEKGLMSASLSSAHMQTKTRLDLAKNANIIPRNANSANITKDSAQGKRGESHQDSQSRSGISSASIAAKSLHQLQQYRISKAVRERESSEQIRKSVGSAVEISQNSSAAKKTNDFSHFRSTITAKALHESHAPPKQSHQSQLQSKKKRKREGLPKIKQDRSQLIVAQGHHIQFKKDETLQNGQQNMTEQAIQTRKMGDNVVTPNANESNKEMRTTKESQLTIEVNIPNIFNDRQDNESKKDTQNIESSANSKLQPHTNSNMFKSDPKTKEEKVFEGKTRQKSGKSQGDSEVQITPRLAEQSIDIFSSETLSFKNQKNLENALNKVNTPSSLIQTLPQLSDTQKQHSAIMIKDVRGTIGLFDHLSPRNEEIPVQIPVKTMSKIQSQVVEQEKKPRESSLISQSQTNKRLRLRRSETMAIGNRRSNSSMSLFGNMKSLDQIDEQADEVKQKVINHLRNSNVSLLKTKIENVLDRAYQGSQKIVTAGLGPLIEDSKQKKQKVMRRFGSMSSMTLGANQFAPISLKQPEEQIYEESNSVLSSQENEKKQKKQDDYDFFSEKDDKDKINEGKKSSQKFEKEGGQRLKTEATFGKQNIKDSSQEKKEHKQSLEKNPQKNDTNQIVETKKIKSKMQSPKRPNDKINYLTSLSQASKDRNRGIFSNQANFLVQDYRQIRSKNSSNSPSPSQSFKIQNNSDLTSITENEMLKQQPLSKFAKSQKNQPRQATNLNQRKQINQKQSQLRSPFVSNQNQEEQEEVQELSKTQPPIILKKNLQQNKLTTKNTEWKISSSTAFREAQRRYEIEKIRSKSVQNLTRTFNNSQQKQSNQKGSGITMSPDDKTIVALMDENFGTQKKNRPLFGTNQDSQTLKKAAKIAKMMSLESQDDFENQLTTEEVLEIARNSSVQTVQVANFLAKIDEDRRENSLKKMAELQSLHEKLNNEYSKQSGGQDSKNESRSDSVKLHQREESNFSREVQGMNFFNIFVNSSVENKHNSPKNQRKRLQNQQLQMIEQSSETSQDQLLAIENAQSKSGKNQETQSSKQQDDLFVVVEKSKEEGDFTVRGIQNMADENDQSHIQEQVAQKVCCNCNSLTNDQIKRILLKSPIKDIVDQIHAQELSTQNPLIGPKPSILDSNSIINGGQSSKAYRVTKRTDVAALDQILDRILTGKYYYGSEQMDQKNRDENWLRFVSKFMDGIDFKVMLTELRQKLDFQTHKQTDFIDPQNDVDNEIDFFSLKAIEEKESVLNELLVTGKMPTNQSEKDKAAVFLTETYKDSKATRQDLNSNFTEWEAKRNIRQASEKLIEEHAKSDFSIHEQHSLLEAKRTRESDVLALFDAIQDEQDEIQKCPIEFFEDQTLSVERKQKNTGRDQMLYLCFLDLVRQVATNCKEQALLLVKIWHCYFDQFNQKMRDVLFKADLHTSRICELLGQFQTKFAKVLKSDEVKDRQFLSLRNKYDKSLDLIEILSKNLYEEREKTKKLTWQLNNLREDVEVVLPNYAKYYQDKDFRSKLMKYSINQNAEVWTAQSDRLTINVTPDIISDMNTQTVKNPFQARILKDIYRIQNVIDIKLPLEIANDRLREELNTSTAALQMKEIQFSDLEERFNRTKIQAQRLQKRISETTEKYEMRLMQMEEETKERVSWAVRKFRQQQLKNILKNVKEVQTDHELIEKYFTDLENERDAGIRAMMISKKLSPVQLLEMKVFSAFEKTPKFKHQQQPIRALLRKVRNGKSDAVAKTLKKTLEIIGEIIQERINIMNEPINDIKVDFQGLEHFFYKYMMNRYGHDAAALRKTEQWLLSTKVHSQKDARVNLLMKFLGLTDHGSLPYSVFHFFLQLIKATNIEVTTIYSGDITRQYINYQKVMFGYRELLNKTNAFNRRNIFMQLRHASEVVANNVTILKELSFTMFSTYRLIVEKVAKSQKYRSFSEFLNALFDLKSKGVTHDALKRKQTLMSKESVYRHGFENAASGMLNQAGEEGVLPPSMLDDAADDGKASPTQKLSARELARDTKSPTNELNRRDNQNNPLNQLDEQDDEKARQADQKDDEPDFVTIHEMINFILKEFAMGQNQYRPIKEMLNVILIRGQLSKPNRISRNKALRAFTEKIEIKLPLDAYFHIGINAQIDHENAENSWYEKVFNFYSQLRPDNYRQATNMEPDHRIKMSYQNSYDGLEFVQFYIFVKDGSSKYAKDKVTVYTIYEDMCMQKSRQRLSCDDFVELVRKFNLIKKREYFENAMRLRYDQAKEHSIRMETIEKGTNVMPTDLGLPSIFNTPNQHAAMGFGGFASSANLMGQSSGVAGIAANIGAIGGAGIGVGVSTGDQSTSNFKLRLESQFTPIGSSGATPPLDQNSSQEIINVAAVKQNTQSKGNAVQAVMANAGHEKDLFQDIEPLKEQIDSSSFASENNQSYSQTSQKQNNNSLSPPLHKKVSGTLSSHKQEKSLKRKNEFEQTFHGLSNLFGQAKPPSDASRTFVSSFQNNGSSPENNNTHQISMSDYNDPTKPDQKKEKYESPNMPPIKELASGTKKDQQKLDSFEGQRTNLIANSSSNHEEEVKLTEETSENRSGTKGQDQLGLELAKSDKILEPQTDKKTFMENPSKETIDYHQLGLDGIEKAIAAKSEFQDLDSLNSDEDIVREDTSPKEDTDIVGQQDKKAQRVQPPLIMVQAPSEMPQHHHNHDHSKPLQQNQQVPPFKQFFEKENDKLSVIEASDRLMHQQTVKVVMQQDSMRVHSIENVNLLSQKSQQRLEESEKRRQGVDEDLIDQELLSIYNEQEEGRKRDQSNENASDKEQSEPGEESPQNENMIRIKTKSVDQVSNERDREDFANNQKQQVLVTDPDEAPLKVPILKKNKTNQKLFQKKFTDGQLDFDKNQIQDDHSQQNQSAYYRAEAKSPLQMEKDAFNLPRMQTLNYQEKTALNLNPSKKSKTTFQTKKLMQQAKANVDLDEMLLMDSDDNDRESMSSASREIKQKSVIFALDLVTDQQPNSRTNKNTTSQQQMSQSQTKKQQKVIGGISLNPITIPQHNTNSSQVKQAEQINLIEMKSDDIGDDMMEPPQLQQFAEVDIDSANAKKTLIDQASDQPEVWSQATQNEKSKKAKSTKTLSKLNYGNAPFKKQIWH